MSSVRVTTSALLGTRFIRRKRKRHNDKIITNRLSAIVAPILVLPKTLDFGPGLPISSSCFNFMLCVCHTQGPRKRGPGRNRAIQSSLQCFCTSKPSTWVISSGTFPCQQIELQVAFLTRTMHASSIKITTNVGRKVEEKNQKMILSLRSTSSANQDKNWEFMIFSLSKSSSCPKTGGIYSSKQRIVL